MKGGLGLRASFPGDIQFSIEAFKVRAPLAAKPVAIVRIMAESNEQLKSMNLLQGGNVRSVLTASSNRLWPERVKVRVGNQRSYVDWGILEGRKGIRSVD